MGSLEPRSFLGRLKRLLRMALVILELDRISAVLCVFAMDIVILEIDRKSAALRRLADSTMDIVILVLDAAVLTNARLETRSARPLTVRPRFGGNGVSFPAGQYCNRARRQPPCQATTRPTTTTTRPTWAPRRHSSCWSWTPPAYSWPS